MKVNKSPRIKTLIDLETLVIKSRGSPKIESLFQSGHQKTRSESSASTTPKHINGLFSTFNSTNKQPNLNTDRLPVKTVSSVQTRNHTRQNSQRDNKENIRVVKEQVSYGPNLLQTKIFKLKEQFERTLKKKHAFRKHTTISQQEISLVLNEMSIMKSTNKYFKEFMESIVEMLQVGYTRLLAINFFLVILALLNMHLSKRQLDTMVLSSYDKDKGNVIEFDKAQVSKIAQTYEEIIGKSSTRQTSRRTPECIQINVTLPDNRKEQMMFRNSEDYQEIAQKIMSKYAIPSQKLRNIENIIQSKLNHKQ